MILLTTLTLAIIADLILFRLYRHRSRELDERNQRIDELETLLKNWDVYIAELQRRCKRRQPQFRQARTCPKFSDYEVTHGDVVCYQSRVWWN